jgi:hypothetical protein
MLNINLLFFDFLFRVIEEKSPLLQDVLGYIIHVLKYTVSLIIKKHDEISHGLTNLSSAVDTMGPSLSSFRSFLSSLLFNRPSVDNGVSSVLTKHITDILDDLLVAISQLFSRLSSLMNNFDGESDVKVLPISCINSEDLNPFVDSNSSVADMDLDVMDSGEADSVTASASMGGLLRPLEWKLELVSTISTFFSVSSFRTWEILYSLMEKESDVKVEIHNNLWLMCLLLFI